MKKYILFAFTFLSMNLSAIIPTIIITEDGLYLEMDKHWYEIMDVFHSSDCPCHFEEPEKMKHISNPLEALSAR